LYTSFPNTLTKISNIITAYQTLIY